MTAAVAVRTVLDSDFDAILALNEAEVQQTSAMDRQRLQALVAISAYSKVAMFDSQVAGFLIALREGTSYDNENFAFFAARYPAFLYVDRIVVAARFAGQRIGSRLYDDLFGFARESGVDVVTCEYNLEPPNPASRAFHDKFGFAQVGTQWVAGGTKRVSMQVAQA